MATTIPRTRCSTSRSTTCTCGARRWPAGSPSPGSRAASRTTRAQLHQYTQKQATKLARKLPTADILLCHCPPLGINDDPEDPAHVGFEGLRGWVDEHHPRHLLHGHTHPLPGHTVKRHGDTHVHWISGAKVLDLH